MIYKSSPTTPLTRPLPPPERQGITEHSSMNFSKRYRNEMAHSHQEYRSATDSQLRNYLSTQISSFFEAPTMKKRSKRDSLSQATSRQPSQHSSTVQIGPEKSALNKSMNAKLMSQMYCNSRNKKMKQAMRRELAAQQARDKTLAEINIMNQLLDKDVEDTLQAKTQMIERKEERAATTAFTSKPFSGITTQIPSTVQSQPDKEKQKANFASSQRYVEEEEDDSEEPSSSTPDEQQSGESEGREDTESSFLQSVAGLSDDPIQQKENRFGPLVPSSFRKAATVQKIGSSFQNTLSFKERPRYGVAFLEETSNNEVSDFTDKEELDQLRRGRPTLVRRNVTKLRTIAEKCSDQRGVSLSSKSIILSKICEEIEAKSHAQKLKEIQRQQSKRKSASSFYQNTGNMSEMIDPLNSMAVNTDAARLRKDREVLDLIVKEINFSKEKRLFNRFIDEKNTDSYMRQLKLKNENPLKSIDARDLRQKLIGRHLLDQEARERLLDYTVLRDFLYEQRLKEQRVRVTQALKKNKFALGIDNYTTIFNNNSALPEVIGPNHIRLDMGKGSKLLSYADKQNLIHRHTVRKALAANMSSNKAKINRENNLELVKFILVYKGMQEERHPQPTHTSKRSAFSKLELSHMVKNLNFNTICNYVNLRRIFHFVSSVAIDFNVRDLTLEKFYLFIRDLCDLTHFSLKGKHSKEQVAQMFNRALFSQSQSLSYEEFYEALRIFTKSVLAIKKDDTLIKPKESKTFDETFLKFVLVYLDIYYEERCSDSIEQLLRKAEFKEFLFQHKSWLYEWFTLFAQFTPSDQTKMISLKQLTEGYAAMDVFPNILSHQQLEHIYRLSLSSSEQLSFEDFVKSLLYVNACCIVMEQQRVKEKEILDRIKHSLQKEKDAKKKGEIYSKMIEQTSQSGSISSANVTQFIVKQNWLQEKYQKKVRGVSYNQLKRELTKESKLLSQENVEKIREATRRIKNTRNASKSITGAHFSVNLRAKVVQL